MPWGHLNGEASAGPGHGAKKNGQRDHDVRVLVYGLAVLLGLLGLVFVVAAGQGNALVRIVVGLVCLVAAGVIVALARLRPVRHTHVHDMQLHLSGDVSLEQMTCRECGAPLSDRSTSVKAGAVFVQCEYCGAQHQLEEAPKW